MPGLFSQLLLENGIAVEAALGVGSGGLAGEGRDAWRYATADDGVGTTEPGGPAARYRLNGIGLVGERAVRAGVCLHGEDGQGLGISYKSVFPY